MKAVSLASERHLGGTPKPRTLDRLACRLVLRQLAALQSGTLELVDGDQRMAFGNGDGFKARIFVNDPSFYSDIAFGGSIGAGESYMHGAWTCDAMRRQVRVICRHRACGSGPGSEPVLAWGPGLGLDQDSGPDRDSGPGPRSASCFACPPAAQSALCRWP